MRGSAVAALLVDLVAGELPTPLHPTVWMGRWIAGGRGRRRSHGPAASLIEGALLVGSGVALSGAAGHALDAIITQIREPFGAVASGVILKPAISLRALLSAADQVQQTLGRGDLEGARKILSWHLVSRDTSDLSAGEVAGAAIESVAENFNDSVVAPLMAFRVGGLGLAYAYRMVNTADAMLGYRTAELEWFGKTAARIDDVANFVPARCAAALVACCAPLGLGSPHRAISAGFADGGNTASPNAGWPMAAMAGALDVRLTKRDCYVLNAGGREPTSSDIRRACRIVAGAAVLAATLVDLS